MEYIKDKSTENKTVKSVKVIGNKIKKIKNRERNG
jgi:hypothetical protein